MEVPRPHDHQFSAVNAKLDALQADLSYLVERQRKRDELFAEMTPILKEVMGDAQTRLDKLDRGGYFAFLRELVQVAERIVQGFNPEDVRQLGDAIVGILQTVRAMTQPEVLAVVGEASAVLQSADQVEPLGILGMVRATRNDDVQKGMAVMMDLMRHVGRAAQLVAENQRSSPLQQKKVKLASVTSAKKKKRPLGIERPPQDASQETRPPKRAEPKQEGTVTLSGARFGADGHLSDPAAWSRDLALEIAAAQGVTLSDAHWSVLEHVRADFAATNVSPNIRRITQVTGIGTKDLYALFPKAPARTAAKIAGVPKPAGCL